MDIIISNSSADPIYQQIVNQIKAMIMDGKLHEGDALPSMRNLAQQLRISVITTKRAYEELERDGMIESVTGKGSFIKAQNPELMREKHLRKIEMLLANVAETASMAHITSTELHEMLDLLLEDQTNN